MRVPFLILAFVSRAIAFDLSSIDTGNANWFPCDDKIADINILVKAKVAGMFDRVESFPFRYVNPKKVVSANGNTHVNYVGYFRRSIPDFNADGNSGWIYVSALSEAGARIRCVIKESKDDGKILYEREFLIPWSTRVFLLDTESEHFNAKIIAKSEKT